MTEIQNAKKKEIGGFRTAIILDGGCQNHPCRQKGPIPREKIYSHRTVEIGVYIDNALYQQMSSEIESTDPTKIRERFVQMVHSIFVDVENFITHKSFTSFSGGFKIAINGIYMYKDDDEHSRKWKSASSLKEMLDTFKEFAYQTNDACDAEDDSYDAMVLFTGRAEQLSDVRPNGAMGYAMVGGLCGIAPASVLTLRMDGKGMHSPSTGRLLAHEFGHLFGSHHDGDRVTWGSGPYRNQVVPCPEGVNLMSPSVNQNENLE